MTFDAGRIRHDMSLMHYSRMSNGSAVPSNWRPSATGDTGVTWTPEASGGSVSYGSNVNEVSYANAPGASSLVSRADHVHRGVTSLSHSSNTYTGPVTLETEGSLYIVRPSDNTFRFGSTGTGGGGGSPGGITHSYLGYNTIGASTENMTQNRVYMKKITVSTAGIITSISAYIQERDNGDHVGDLAVALYSDNAGSPDKLQGGSEVQSITAALIQSAGVQGAARWFHRPLGIYVTAGDYWIAVMEATPTTGHRIYKDGSGSDRYYTSGGGWFIDSGFYTVTTSTDKYSIRASIIS